MYPTKVFRICSLTGKSSKNKYQVKLTFIAEFENSEVKMLTELYNMNTDLITSEYNNEKVLLGKNECRLYYCNWENNPENGTFKNNYPNKN